jgi:hypothetical protein
MARHFLHHSTNWEHLYLRILKVVKEKQFISLNHYLGGFKDLKDDKWQIISIRRLPKK